MDRRSLLNDTEESLRLAMDGRQSTIWTALPGIVQSVNFDEMTCTVQPSIQGSYTDENNITTNIKLPVLLDVPIVFPSAGGFTITLPLAVNDEVLVVFASRCIDSWWQQGGIQVPPETRMHDLSDGFAIPGPKSLPKKISGISTTGAQIRNDAGTSYVEISGDGKIKLVSPSEIDITGDLKVSGTINVEGDVIAQGDVTAGIVPISLTTHVHSGVATGGGNSGPPVP